MNTVPHLRKYGILTVLFCLFFAGAVHATETVPTTLSDATSSIASFQASVESDASWGLFILGSITAALVLISWLWKAAMRAR